MSSRFRPFRRFEQINAIVALPLAALLVPFPVAAQTVQVVVAPGSGNTRVYTTPGANGVPVVEVNTANAAGLSHNKFTHYNVPTQGLALNNAAPTQFNVNSQLAGTITTNFNLKAPAGVILNEVVAPNASTIAGFTEIVGGKADLVVANPYGIAVKGGGFINTDRVTLATGTPILGANGALTGLRVGQGELTIAKDAALEALNGLNASNVSVLNLLARSVKVDGQLNAQDLVIATGPHDFDYASRTVTANSSAAAGVAPALALDSSAVGGMYANRIRLVATEAGVGVRMLGDVAATTDDLAVDAAGRVQLSNKVSAERDLNVVATGGVAVAGTASSLTAKRDIGLDAKASDLSFSDGQIVAGRDLALTGGSLVDTTSPAANSANRFAVGALNLSTTGSASVSGSAYGAGSALDVQVGSGSFSNLAAFYSGADEAASARGLTLRATSGDLDTGNAQIQSPAALGLTADRGAVRIGGSGNGIGVQAATNLTLAGFSGITNAGNVTAGRDLAVRPVDGAQLTAVANSGRLIAGRTLTVGAGATPSLTLDNTGTGILGGQTIDVRADTAANAGTIQGTQGVTLTVRGSLSNAADAAILTATEAGRDVAITASALNNAGYVQSTGALTLAVSGNATNTGVIATQSSAQGGSDRGLVFTAGALTNSGTVQSAGTLALTNASIVSNSGTLQSVGAASLTVGSRLNQSASGAILGGNTVAIQSGAGAFTVESAGRIQAAQALTIGTSAAPVALTQGASGVLLAGGAATVQASTIDNAGLVQASDALALSATASLENRSGGKLLTANNADKAIALTAASLTNAGQIQSTGAVAATIASAINNSGAILSLNSSNGGASRSVTFSSDTFANSGTVQSAGAIEINARSTATAVANTGNLIATGAAKLTSGGRVENQGNIIASDTLTLTAPTLVNSGGMQSDKNLTATIGRDLQNAASGLILTVGSTPADVALTSATLNNAGTVQSTGALTATADTIVNSGKLNSGGALTARSATLLTNTGVIQSAATLDLIAPQAVQNSGNIVSASDLTLQTGTLGNAANAVIFAGRTLNTAATNGIENAGLIRGSSGAVFTARDAFNNLASGTVVTTQSGANLALASGTFTNAGKIQSTGAFSASVGGALLNSSTGVIVTANAAKGGSGGSLATKSGSFVNQGWIESASTVNIEATVGGVTSFTNAGRIQAATGITIIAPTRQENTGTGLVLGGGDVTLRSGRGDFTLANAGTLQAGNNLSLGFYSERTALENSGSALGGWGIDVSATTVNNSGTLQGTSGATINASGAVNNRGMIDSGGTGIINAASLTNSGTVQSTARLDITTGGATTNSGTIATRSGDMYIQATDVTNTQPSSIISSGGQMFVTTVGASPVTLTNNGTINSGAAMTLTTRNGLVNSGTGTINGGGHVTILSGGAGFTASNAGAIQSGANLSIGAATDRVALTNEAGGLIRAAGNLTALASTVSNSGTVQGVQNVTLNLTGALTNTATGNIVTSGGPGANINITGASLANAGQIQSTGAIDANVSGAIANSGAWLTTGTGAINASGATITNTGVIESRGTLGVVAATNITNAASGRIQSASDMALTSPTQLANAGAILSGRHLTVMGGSTAFDVMNDGRMQAAQNFTFGSAGARAALTNAPVASNAQNVITQGVIAAGGTLNGFATTVVNHGALQSHGALAIDATGALTNSAGARLLSTNVEAPSAMTLTAASLSNHGDIAATGALAATVAGALTNTGKIITAGSSNLSAAVGSLDNAAGAAIQSAGALTLTTNTTLANAGTLQAAQAVALTTPQSLTNASTGRILSDMGGITLSGGSSAFAITNDGRMQAAQDFTFGSDAARATLVNNPASVPGDDGVITQGAIQAGGALTGFATAVTNFGLVQANGALQLNATGAITNHQNARLLAGLPDQAAAATFTAASFSNTGDVQSRGDLTATLSGSLTNSGTLATVGVGSLAATAGSLTNSGSIDSSGALSVTTNTSVTNSGTLKSVGALALTTPGALTNQAAGVIASASTISVVGGSGGFALENQGRIQSGAAMTIGSSGARAAVTNTANAVMLSGDTLTANTSTFTNSGTVQAGNALTIAGTGALHNHAAGKILTAGTPGRAVAVSGSNLTNAGTLQSTGAMTAAFTGTIENTGTLATLSSAHGGSDASLTATAGGAFTNARTISSAGDLTLSAGTTFANNGGLQPGVINAAGDAIITTGSSLTNAAGATLASGGNLTVKGTSAFALENAGRIQSGGDLVLGESARRAGFTNSVNATVRSGGDFTGFFSAFTNHANVQIGGRGALTVNSGVTLTNHAAGKLVAGDALTIGTTSGNFGISNAGLIQSGGQLTIGAAGRTATIDQTGTTAKLFADTFVIHAGAVTNKGMIMGLEGGTLSATSFINEGSGSRFIASTGTGQATVNVTGTLTNQGAMHASGNFTLNAATIENTSTGGISSLEALTLNASEDIINRSNGALYSGGKMTLIAGDDITNHEDGTIDTDGDFAVTATSSGSRFLNQGAINIAGNATITARSFENVMAGAENVSRFWKGLPTSGSTIHQNNYKTGSDPIPDVSTTRWYYTGNSGFSGSGFSDRKSTISGYFYHVQEFTGVDNPDATFGNKTKPQISANNLTIDGFDTARNVGGLITASNKLTLRGRTSGATFLNDALTLEIEKWNYTGRWSYDYSLMGDYNWWDPSDGIESYDTTIATVQDYFSIGAGLRAGSIDAQGFSLTLLGSANAPTTQKSTAQGGSMEGLGTATTVGGAIAASGDTSITVTGAAIKAGSGTKLFGRAVAAASTASVSLGSANERGATGNAGVSSAEFRGGVTARNLENAEAPNGGAADPFAPNAAANRFDVASTFSPAATAALANALKNATVALNGITLKLPSNPNGLFVPNADPKAKFLVGVNSTFGIDPSSAVGSDELFKKLGVNPDVVQKRLGDASYETYLVRQQLVDQLGSKFLAGQKSEAAQMQTLMANAASEARRLGLQVGQAPSAAQLAALGQDMVWMVEQVVAGQRVLVPQVYLSAKTRGMFDPTNSNLAADSVNLDLTSFKNTGGNVAGKDSLTIKSAGDIENLSGNISGGNVKLDAGGTIRNETLVRGDDNSTVVSKTAGISSTGTMDLSAGKDIKIIGADVNAAGAASIAAKGDIVVDTVQKKTSTTTTTTSEGFFSGSSTTTTVSEVKNQASNLNFGSNVKISSGGDTTLAGSNLNVAGNLDTDIKGDLNILARQDQRTVETKSDKSGIGVGGGLYGTQTTTTNDFTGTNVGSTINVGGNANLNTGSTLTVEGSKLNVAGNATVTAKDVQILDGKDERRTTTTTTTTTIGAWTDSGTKADANAKGQVGPLGASGSASAQGSANGELTVGIRTETETRRDYESKSVGSQLNIGGNLQMNVQNDVTLRGSNIDAKGDVDVNAKNINVLAGQNVKTSTTDTVTATAGLYLSGSAGGEANAQGGTGAGYSEAGAKGSAEVGAGLKTQLGTSSSTTGSSTAATSGISGRNVNLNAENKITEEGARLNATNNLTLSATSLESRAAADKTWSSSSSDTVTTRTGVYADAQGEANAGGVEGTGVSGSVSAGFKSQVQTDSNSSSSSSSTARTSTYGGTNVTLNIKEKASLEGTNITATNNVDLTAGSLDYKAARNTSSSSSDNLSTNLEAKLGVGAGGSASATGGAEGGYGVTVKGKLGAEGGSAGNSSSTAVVGGINGANVTVKTTQGDANLEGTNINATNNATLDVKGNLNFTEARNTSSSTSNNYNGEIKAEFGSYNNEVEGKGGYSQQGSSSNTATTGSINAGKNLTVTAGGNATLVGTDLNSGGDTTLGARGSVNLLQATSTTSSSGFNVSGEGKIGADGGHVKAQGGYDSANSSTADTANINAKGNVTITSGADTNVQGSNISAGKVVSLDAGGGLNVTTKQESSSSLNASASGGFGAGGVALNGEVGGSRERTSSGATISGGTGVNLNSGKAGTTLQATQVSTKSGDVNVTSQGQVTQTSATSSSVSGSIGASIGSATNPGVTDLSLDGSLDTQRTSLSAGGGGKVNVQSGVAAPSGAAIKKAAAPKLEAAAPATNEGVLDAKPSNGGIVAPKKVEAPKPEVSTSGEAQKVEAKPVSASIAVSKKVEAPKLVPTTTGTPINTSTAAAKSEGGAAPKK
jgi:filamentous hemagglutinin family protein